MSTLVVGIINDEGVQLDVPKNRCIQKSRTNPLQKQLISKSEL